MLKRLGKIAVRFLVTLAWFLVTLTCLLIVGMVGVSAWLNFYTGDLPDVSAMARFCPVAPQQTSIVGFDEREIRTLAVPAAGYQNVREALLAAEGEFPSHGVYRETYESWTADMVRVRKGWYSLWIARTMQRPDKHLQRQIRELRTAHQLERQFTRDQLLSIYLNTAYFGDETWGIEGAAHHYFGKHASELTTPEAALVIGLIQRPSYYLQTEHSERALERRNEVLGRMMQRGSVTADEAQAWKRLELGTVNSSAQ
jgi:membrane carboxypeptidase/penicillin-binding protein